MYLKRIVFESATKEEVCSGAQTEAVTAMSAGDVRDYSLFVTALMWAVRRHFLPGGFWLDLYCGEPKLVLGCPLSSAI